MPWTLAISWMTTLRVTSRVVAADGTQQEVLAKKNLLSDDNAGWGIFRSTGNVLTFKFSDGSAPSYTPANTTTSLQNVWRHFAVTVDRNGYATTYLNGVADGTPVDISGLTSGANAVSLYLGRDGTNFGQVDLGGVRIYRFAAGALPSNAATIIANNFAAERALFGI
jgi:hypothetical protein